MCSRSSSSVMKPSLSLSITGFRSDPVGSSIQDPDLDSLNYIFLHTDSLNQILLDQNPLSSEK
uniref:Uncharacterized protein n=1 Tax=Romanomermis culicivorax TaxID=13658 RepID=A0A915J4Q7_ROMCU